MKNEIDWNKLLQKRANLDLIKQNDEDQQQKINEIKIKAEQGDCIKLAQTLEIPQLLTSLRDKVWQYGEDVRLERDMVNLGFVSSIGNNRFWHEVYMERPSDEDIGYVQYELVAKYPYVSESRVVNWGEAFVPESFSIGRGDSINIIIARRKDDGKFGIALGAENRYLYPEDDDTNTTIISWLTEYAYRHRNELPFLEKAREHLRTALSMRKIIKDNPHALRELDNFLRDFVGRYGKI